MTWHDLEPVRVRGPIAAAAGVNLSVNSGKRSARRLTMVLRLPLIDQPPAWLALGETVRVQMGETAGAWCLRLTHRGPHHVQKASGVGFTKNGVLMIRLPTPMWTRPGAHVPTPVEFDHNDTFLELTLPWWAQPPAEAVVVEVTAADWDRGKSAPVPLAVARAR